jgi:hypothetical protein
LKYFLSHLLDEEVGELEMSALIFSGPDPEAADHCVFALEALVPSVWGESISFYEPEEDGVDAEGGGGSDQGVDFVVFDEERDEFFGEVPVGSHHYNLLAVHHYISINESKSIITSFYSSCAPSPPSASCTPCGRLRTDSPLASAVFLLFIVLPLSFWLGLGGGACGFSARYPVWADFGRTCGKSL